MTKNFVFEETASERIFVTIKESRYVLEPATAGDVIDFKDTLMNRTSISPRGEIKGFRAGIGDLPCVLLAKCLWLVDDSENKIRLVSREELLNFRSDTIEKLYTILNRISGLSTELETIEHIDKEIERLSDQIAELQDLRNQKASEKERMGN